MAKVRMTIELNIDETVCKEYKIKPQEIFEALDIYQSNVIDGYEIYAVHPNLDLAYDFVLGDAYVVSKEIVK